jgi:hypothetical protein
MKILKLKGEGWASGSTAGDKPWGRDKRLRRQDKDQVSSIASKSRLAQPSKERRYHSLLETTPGTLYWA